MSGEIITLLSVLGLMVVGTIALKFNFNFILTIVAYSVLIIALVFGIKQ